MKYAINLCLVLTAAFSLTLSSCKDKPTEPEGECRVTGMKSNGGGTRSFVYDATTGLIKTFNIFNNGFNTKMDLTHNSQGQLVSTLYTFDKNVAYKELYTYQNGRIVTATEVDPKVETSVWTVHNLKYDEQGRITEYTTVNNDASDTRFIFGYDAQGIQTKFEVYTLAGVLQYRQIITPAGTPVKSTETFLMERGLPYELYYGNAYPLLSPGVGSKMEIYTQDAVGNIVLALSLTLKSQNVDAKGFVTETTWGNTSGNDVTSFSFAGCK